MSEFMNAKVEKFIRTNLPPLQPGREWAILIYPGGRSEWRQVTPGQVMSLGDAIDVLLGPNPARVLVNPLDGTRILAVRESRGWSQGATE